MLEIIARVPYQTWELVAYIAVTHVHQSTGIAKRIQDRIVEVRSKQDNEPWHLLILQDLITRRGVRESRLKFFWLPQLIALRLLPVLVASVRRAAQVELRAQC